MTLALPLNRNNSIKIYGSGSVYTSAGSDFKLIGVV